MPNTITNPNFIHVTSRDGVVVAIPTHNWSTIKFSWRHGGPEDVFKSFTVAELLRNINGSFIPR